MAIEETAELTHTLEQQWAEEQKFQERIRSLEREHELRLKQLELVEKYKAQTALKKAERGVRVWLAIVKIVPVLILCAALPFILIWREDVPESIQRFISL